MKKYILIVSVLLLFSLTVYAQEEIYNSEEFKEIVSMLSMQGHAEHDLTCPTKKAYYEEVAEMITEGQTKEQIINYYVGQYGEAALKVPYKKGFSLVAWLTPFIILTVAGLGVFIGVNKWVKSGKEEAVDEINEPLDETEAEILKNIIDEERKKYF